MKKSIVLLAAWILFTPLFGQEIQEAVSGNKSNRFEFKFTGGTTFTLVPDFHHHVLVTEGIIIPGLFIPANSSSLLITKCRSTSRSQVGWFAEAGVGYRLPKNYSLSFSVGVKKLRFDYRTEFPDILGIEDPDDINSEFGRTSLLYLSVTPFNISKGFLQNRLSVQAGPTLSWLLESEVMNALMVYNSQASIDNKMPERMYFDTTGKFKKTLVGLNVGVEHKIVDHVRINVSGQYYFNSFFEKEGLYQEYFESNIEKVNPISIQAGITFSL